MYTTFYTSPLGAIELTADDSALLALHFCEAKKIRPPNRTATAPNAILTQAVSELAAYFAHELQVFTVPVRPEGTSFQESVWRELLHIPYGTTISYKTLADRLGNPKVIRAAASANGKNPVSLLVPCHRVIGADGSLVGYGGDIWRKERLLQLENPRLVVQTLF